MILVQWLNKQPTGINFILPFSLNCPLPACLLLLLFLSQSHPIPIRFSKPTRIPIAKKAASSWITWCQTPFFTLLRTPSPPLLPLKRIVRTRSLAEKKRRRDKKSNRDFGVKAAAAARDSSVVSEVVFVAGSSSSSSSAHERRWKKGVTGKRNLLSAVTDIYEWGLGCYCYSIHPATAAVFGGKLWIRDCCSSIRAMTLLK